LNAHQSTVTAIVATSKERTVITGTKAGDVIVWTFNGIVNQSQSWNVKKHLCDHEGMISSIHINEDMCMYLTSSFDGSVNIYNLWTDKFTRKFIHPKLSPIHSAILTKTPLPACCFFSREDHFWYSYSMNNSEKMLEKQREECSHMISPHVIKDSHFMERLVYGTEKGYLIFR
jgi:WD40 repeat protein